ncbi:hypothetical protein TNCV_4172251 [Trichonephila clavipes]|nr:hypothetical protein TNCV_4172251 [Trichonephila clavipes]
MEGISGQSFIPSNISRVDDEEMILPVHGVSQTVPCINCGGGIRGCIAIYRPFGEFRRAKSDCHLYGAQGQRQAYF